MSTGGDLYSRLAQVGRLGPAALFALTPAAAVGGGLALAPLAGAAGLLSLRPALILEAVRARPRFSAALAAFTAWVLLSSLWTSFEDHSLVYRLGVTFLPGLPLVVAAGAEAPLRALIRAGVLAAVIVTLGLLVVEAFAGLPLNRLAQPEATAELLERNPGRGATVMVILIWSCLGALIAHGGGVRLGAAALIAAVCALVSLQFGMQANAVAFVLGVAAFAAAYALPGPALLLAASGLAAWLAVAPFLTPWLIRALGVSGALPELVGHAHGDLALRKRPHCRATLVRLGSGWLTDVQ